MLQLIIYKIIFNYFFFIVYIIMEVNLIDFWLYIKDKLIYIITITIIIYFICKLSNKLLSRILVLNKIKYKITDLEKKKDYENFYMKEKNIQINNISSKVIYEQNIHNSLNNELLEVKKYCNEINNKYINNINNISTNIPKNVKIKLHAYITKMNDIEKQRKINEEKQAELEYELKKKETKRQMDQIREAVNERIKRKNAIALAKHNAKIAANKAKLAAKQVAQAVSRGIFGNFFCIKEDTLIKMSDNSFKKVKDIIIGDEVLGINNNINKVSNIHKELINEDIYVYGINNIDPFFTNTHPIISATDNNIVFSIKPELTLIENPERKNKISKLKIGDMIYINNNIVKVEEITNKILKKNSYVYDLIFDNFNDYTYIANNIIIESQEPKWFKYPKVTGVLLNLLLNYKYEDINIELINKYKNNNYNLNDVIKFYEIIKTYNKKDFNAFLNNLNNLWKNYYNIIQK